MRKITEDLTRPATKAKGIRDFLEQAMRDKNFRKYSTENLAVPAESFESRMWYGVNEDGKGIFVTISVHIGHWELG